MTAEARLKLAELTGGIGAGVLGAGLGLAFAVQLSQHWVAISIVGLLLHAWGMFDKHQLEKKGNTVIPLWGTAAYWICWLMLAALAIALLPGVFT